MTSRLAAVAGALLCASGTALAADLPVAPPPAPVLPPPVVFDWTGFYLGIQGGYAGDWISDDDVCGNDFSPFRYCGGAGVDGFVGGGHVGYLWQFGQFVVGLEGDAEWADIDRGDDGPFADDWGGGYRIGASREYNFLASARLRAGWAINRWLVYATGGYAYANANVETRQERLFGDNDDFDAFDENSLGLNGFTVGAGVDAFVTPDFTVGLEYRYSDFENTTIVGNRLVDGPDFDAGELANNFHAIRVRAAYHF